MILYYIITVLSKIIRIKIIITKLLGFLDRFIFVPCLRSFFDIILFIIQNDIVPLSMIRRENFSKLYFVFLCFPLLFASVLHILIIHVAYSRIVVKTCHNLMVTFLNFFFSLIFSFSSFSLFFFSLHTFVPTLIHMHDI